MFMNNNIDIEGKDAIPEDNKDTFVILRDNVKIVHKLGYTIYDGSVGMLESIIRE